MIATRFTRRRSGFVPVSEHFVKHLTERKTEYKGNLDQLWRLAGTDVTQVLESGSLLYYPTTFPDWKIVVLTCHLDRGVIQVAEVDAQEQDSTDLWDEMLTPVQQQSDLEVIRSVRFDAVYDIRTGPSSDDWNSWLDQYWPQKDYFATLTKKNQYKYPPFREDCAFVLMWETAEPNENPSVSLMAHNKEETWHIIEAIYVVVLHGERKLKAGLDVDLRGWLLTWWREADKDASGSVDLKELWHFLRRRNLAPPLEETLKKFELVNFEETADDEGNQTLNPAEFLLLMRVLFERNEIFAIYDMHCKGYTMTLPEVRDFMIKQGDKEATIEDAAARVELYDIKMRSVSREAGVTPGMSHEGFRLWFSSDEFNCTGKLSWNSPPDLHHAVYDYFIQGAFDRQPFFHEFDENQHSQEIYVYELMRGARFLHLDVWDGGDGQPRVFHDIRMQTGISFLEIIRGVVATHAFRMSELPLILTMDVHCTERQQKAMASILEQYLEEYMWKPKLGTVWNWRKRWQNFTPDKLRRKIILLIKGNYYRIRISGTGQLNPETLAAIDQAYNTDAHDLLVPELLALRTCQLRTKFEDLREDDEDHEIYINYLDEVEAAKTLIKDQATSIRYHTQRMTIVHPCLRRQDQTNTDPMIYWLAGVQIVALDNQIGGYSTLLESALFRTTAKSGYFLKPKAFRQHAFEAGQDLQANPLRLNLTIISGLMLPQGATKPPIFTKTVTTPFVIVRAVGHPRDAKQRFVTSDGTGGLNPIWNEKSEFKFYCPEMAFLSFLIKTKDSGAKDKSNVRGLCYSILRVENTMTGYRHVDLRNADGSSAAPATLLIHLERINTKADHQSSQKTSSLQS